MEVQEVTMEVQEESLQLHDCSWTHWARYSQAREGLEGNMI